MSSRHFMYGWLLVSCFLVLVSVSNADELPTASLPKVIAGRPGHVLPEPSGRGSSHQGFATGPSSWWLAPVGLVAALAAFGGVVIVARRFHPGLMPDGSGPVLRVIGRTSLTPKHTMHLVRAGDRVFLIGTGPQGAPTFLSELDEVSERSIARGGPV